MFKRTIRIVVISLDTKKKFDPEKCTVFSRPSQTWYELSQVIEFFNTHWFDDPTDWFKFNNHEKNFVKSMSVKNFNYLGQFIPGLKRYGFLPFKESLLGPVLSFSFWDKVSIQAHGLKSRHRPGLDRFQKSKYLADLLQFDRIF